MSSCSEEDERMKLQGGSAQFKNATESKRVKPIIQSYRMTPSFVQKNNNFSRGIARPLYPHPLRNIHPKTYPISTRGPNYYERSVRPLLQFSTRGSRSKRSSKVWIRPSEKTATTSATINGSTSTQIPSATVVSKVSKTDEAKVQKIPVNMELSFDVANMTHNQNLSVSTSVRLDGRSGPIKPIVPLNKKMRFKLVKQGSSNKITSGQGSASGYNNSSSMPAIYKLDRRVKAYPTGCDIARRTIIAGLNLSQRRSSLAAYARKSFQNKSALKFIPATKINSPRNFIVRQYSIKRIRKLSFKATAGENYTEVLEPRKRNGKVLTSLKNERTGLILSGEAATGSSKLELSSLSQSLSQNPTVRLANRFVQRSKQRLSASKRKKNTFCIFYNRFGVCKRRDDEACPFVHDPRQLQVCSMLLTNGNCDTNDCKLSHNLSEGKIPPCRFFNEGACSRENCRYLHVLTVSKKKLRQNKFRRSSSQAQKPEALQKPKDSTLDRKNVTKPNSDNHTKTEEKSRYFETLPDSQPIVAIIPRRYPKGLVVAALKATEDEQNESSDSEKSDSTFPSSIYQSCESESSSVPKTVDVPIIPSGGSLSTELLEGSVDPRRQRLLGKLSKLKKDLRQNVSKAPSFLAFNSK